MRIFVTGASGFVGGAAAKHFVEQGRDVRAMSRSRLVPGKTMMAAFIVAIRGTVLQATLLAMRRAVLGLSVAPVEAIVDGNQCPTLACPVHAIYGERDALYKSWITDLEAAYRRVTPDLRGFALIEGAGHWVQFEAPERFDAELARALVD